MTSINLGFFTNWHSSLHPQALGLCHFSPLITETHTHTQTQFLHPSIPPFSLLMIMEKILWRSNYPSLLSVISKGGKLEQLCQDGHMGRNCTVIGCTYACDSTPCSLMAPIVKARCLRGHWLGLRTDATSPHPPHPSKVSLPLHLNIPSATPIPQSH